MRALLIITSSIFAACAYGATIAEKAEYLIGIPPGMESWAADINANRIEVYDGATVAPSWSSVQAVDTNSAEFVAWLADRNADATDDAALGQEMTTALVTAIAAEWPSEPQFTGERKQVRKLTRRLIVESKAARQTLDDSNATIEDRLDAIAKLRRLDVISGYANQLGIGAK